MTETQKPIGWRKTNRHIRFNEVFASKLIRANCGVQTEYRVNGKRCFIQHEKTDDLAGDTWSLQLVSQNPERTVYFASLISMLASECQGARIFRMVTRAELNQVRKAHKTVVAAEKACAHSADQTALADTMLAVAKVPDLARTYRHYLIQRAIGIYTKEGMENDVSYFDAHKVLVEVAPEDSRPRVQRRMEKLSGTAGLCSCSYAFD